MKDKTKYKKTISIILFLIGIFILILVFLPDLYDLFPSEEKLCDNAIEEAKYFLTDSQYDLAEWWDTEQWYTGVDSNDGGNIVSYKITDTNCDVWDRNNIEVRFSLDVKTSKNKYANVEAIVSIYDGYAEDIEFNLGF